MPRKNPYQSALWTSLIAVVLILVAIFVIKPRHEASEKNKDQAKLLFSEDNEKWTLTGLQTFDADRSTVDGMVSTILAAKNEGAVTGSQDLAALGLSPPKFKLSLDLGATHGGSKELLMGEDTPVDYLVYAKWTDKPEVFLTSRSLRFTVDKKVTEMRNKKVFQFLAAEQQKIEVKVHGRAPWPTNLNLSFEKGTTGPWTVKNNPRATKGFAVDTAELEKFASDLSNLTITSFASEDPKDRATKLGFSRPLAELTLTPQKSTTAWTYVLSGVDEKTTAKAGEKTKNTVTHYYFARTDQSSTFEVPETFANAFKTDLFHFRPKTIASLQKDLITGLMVTDTKTSLEFAKDPSGKWATKAGAALDGAFVDKALSQVVALHAEEFLDDASPAKTGLSRPTRIIEIRGKKDGAEATLATLAFGAKLPGGKVVVRAEGFEAPAAITMNVDDVFPVKEDTWLAPPAPAKLNPPTTTPATQSPETPKGNTQ